MFNTIGTIIRALCVLMTLVAGWFFAVMVVYALAALALGVSFSWGHAGIAFGVVILFRMMYPRNVFAG